MGVTDSNYAYIRTAYPKNETRCRRRAQVTLLVAKRLKIINLFAILVILFTTFFIVDDRYIVVLCVVVI